MPADVLLLRRQLLLPLDAIQAGQWHAKQLREVAVNLNVGNLMLLLQFGNMDKQTAKYNTKLFAEQVAPKMRGLFDEWEHRWWPSPMDTGTRANVPAWTPRLAAE